MGAAAGSLLPTVLGLRAWVPKSRQLIADRAYNYVTDKSFALLVWRLGYTTIYDLHPSQRGMHPGPEGTHTFWIDGVLYADGLPDDFYDLEPIEVEMSEDEVDRVERRHQARQAYAFVPHNGRRSDGSRGYRGPNNPRSMRAPQSVTTTSCALGQDCGCGCTAALYDTDYPDMRMPFQHGTLAWEASNHRRVGIESVFANLKQNRLHVHRGYFRRFGIGEYTVLVGFTLVALDVLDWYCRRARLDPCGRFLGEPEPVRAIGTRRLAIRCGEEPSASS